MTEPISINQAIDQLKALRDSGLRNSQKVVHLAEFILENPTRINRLGDEIWTVYEQIAVASCDVGNTQLAKTIIQRLEKQFPDSARVTVLHGMLMEAQGDLLNALDFYEKELCKPFNSKKSDLGSIGELNIRVRKRLIALHLNHSPPHFSQYSQSSTSSPFSIQTGIQLLIDHLDTVYSDPEGWLQLAEVYASLGLYQQSLSALEDLILLQPENTFHILRYAETAYTAGEYELAYETYLRVIELSDRISGESKGGPCRRAAIGLKVCIQRLPKSNQIKEIEKLIDRELENCYSQDWVPLQPGLRVASESSRKSLKTFLVENCTS